MRRENFLKLDSGAAASMTGTVLGWNRLALQAIRSTQPGPPLAARALAILHTCMYNAWAAYDDTARQTAHGVAVRLPRAERSAASKAAAMSHAAYRALVDLFPAQRAVLDAWMAGLGLDPAAGGGPLSPAGIGRGQAAAMREFCRRDGAARLGGLVGGGAADADTDAPQQDRPPVVEPAPGRWCLAAHRLSELGTYGDDQDVRLFFALANALADAAVAGWGEEHGHDPGRAAGDPRQRRRGRGRGDQAFFRRHPLRGCRLGRAGTGEEGRRTRIRRRAPLLGREIMRLA
jgi:hypothetical protein